MVKPHRDQSSTRGRGGEKRLVAVSAAATAVAPRLVCWACPLASIASPASAFPPPRTPGFLSHPAPSASRLELDPPYTLKDDEVQVSSAEHRPAEGENKTGAFRLQKGKVTGLEGEVHAKSFVVPRN